MSCKYCSQYIARALKEVPNFEASCVILHLDPRKPSDAEPILNALGQIGQFGSIRLARKFPFVTDEAQFQMVARTALEFYWMLLDFWEEQREAERLQRDGQGLAERDRLNREIEETVKKRLEKQRHIQERVIKQTF